MPGKVRCIRHRYRNRCARVESALHTLCIIPYLFRDMVMVMGVSMGCSIILICG